MGCELISLRGVADAWEGGDLIPWMRSGQIPLGGVGGCLGGVWGDAWEGCGRMPLERAG